MLLSGEEIRGKSRKGINHKEPFPRKKNPSVKPCRRRRLQLESGLVYNDSFPGFPFRKAGWFISRLNRESIYEYVCP